METTKTTAPIFGLMAEYRDPDLLVAAAERAYEEGYRKMDAYAPYPVEGLAEAIGFKRNALPLLVLTGGITGCLTGLAMMGYTAVVDYPLNVGGRPLFSWPSFIPIMFEMTILFASLTAVFGMLLLNGLPMPHHPVFNVRNFALASRNRFFLCIQADDPKFDRESTKQFLEGLGPKLVSEIEDDR
ncbi:DUF3341 domain-containing protein [Singulisphaera sp. PoT]|uniref:DUF3341 domain-containing protein n=1 Tax=Singulisphaera sp. PoT TaxID=3411797 RepID=UPI003BF480B3